VTATSGLATASPQLLGGLVFLVVGLMFVFIALPALARERRYHAHGREVDAMVLVKQLSHATSDASTVHRITYRAAVEGLAAPERSEAVDVVLWDQATVGKPLRARYLPNAPDSVRLLPAPSVMPFAALAAVGGFVSAFGAALVVSAIRARLRA
jgi:Protein of unknown function (DUF3592)